MTEPIAFGDIRIVDHNQNDLLDLGTDAVTDEKSQPLPGKIQQAKLDGILKTIDVSKWKGVSLMMAARLFNGLTKAELMAKQGYVLGTEMALAEADQGADGVHLKLSFTKKQAFLRTALRNGIAYRMREAKQDAKNGESVSTVKMHLDFATQYAGRLQGEFQETVTLDPAQEKAILKQAYLNRVAKLYEDLEKAANKGDIEMHRLRFGELSWTLTDAQKDFNLKLSKGPDAHLEMEKRLYQNGIPYHYRLAAQDAADGDVFSAKVRLQRLRHYVDYSNQNFQTAHAFDEKKGQSILKTAYEKAVRKALDEALALAKKALLDESEAKLALAHSLTEEYNREIARPQKLKEMAFDKDFEKKVVDCSTRQVCP